MGGHWFEELFGDPNSVSEESLAQAALQSLHDQTGMSPVDPQQCIVNILKVIYPLYSYLSIVQLIWCSI